MVGKVGRSCFIDVAPEFVPWIVTNKLNFVSYLYTSVSFNSLLDVYVGAFKS